MSGGRKWDAKRSDFKKEPELFNKMLNASKYSELERNLEETYNIFKSNEDIRRMTRKVMEEVTNIVDHNKSWNWISVTVKSNTSNTTCKVKIKYDGGIYYDPAENKINNVMGESLNKFKGHHREHNVDTDTLEVCIDIKFKILDGIDVE